mmetsp:Transcript_12233/g.28696  ORF Transcript_12233/g.28696 Transcript_12233/m.28696 type:complete len:100 (-) Transcript_12233:776-1075(-)
MDDAIAPDAGADTFGFGGASKESKIDDVIPPEAGADTFGFEGGGASKESKIDDDIAPAEGAGAGGFGFLTEGTSYASNMDDVVCFVWFAFFAAAVECNS